MERKIKNLIAGLLIPAFGSIIFNALNYMLQSVHGPSFPPEVFDIALGCSFTVVGVAVAEKNANRSQKLFLAFIALILVLILTNIILAHTLPEHYRIWLVFIGNVLAISIVTRAIWNA